MEAGNTKTGQLTAQHSPRHGAESFDEGRVEDSNWAGEPQSERVAGDMNAHPTGNMSVQKHEIPKYRDYNHNGGEFMRSTETTETSVNIGFGKLTSEFHSKRSYVKEIEVSQAMSEGKGVDQFAEVAAKNESCFQRVLRLFGIRINISLRMLIDIVAKLFGCH